MSASNWLSSLGLVGLLVSPGLGLTATPTQTNTPTQTPISQDGCCAAFLSCASITVGNECAPGYLFKPGYVCAGMSCVKATPTRTPTQTPTNTPTVTYTRTKTPTSGTPSPTPVGANVCCHCPGSNCVPYPCPTNCTPVPNAACESTS